MQCFLSNVSKMVHSLSNLVLYISVVFRVIKERKIMHFGRKGGRNLNHTVRNAEFRVLLLSFNIFLPGKCRAKDSSPGLPVSSLSTVLVRPNPA